MDLIATNVLGRALYAPCSTPPLSSSGGSGAPNTPSSCLDEEASREFSVDWEQGADDLVTVPALGKGHRHIDETCDAVTAVPGR